MVYEHMKKKEVNKMLCQMHVPYFTVRVEMQKLETMKQQYLSGTHNTSFIEPNILITFEKEEYFPFCGFGIETDEKWA